MAERDEPAATEVERNGPPAKPAGAEPDPAATEPTAAALARLRERIDAIDQEIVTLLNERAQIALEIGRVKQATGRRTVRDARREEQVIEHVTSASAGLFPEPELVALYRRLIAATRRVQHAQRRQTTAAEAVVGNETAPEGGGRPAERQPGARPAPDIPPGPR